jgi:hypothetical protein
MWKIPTQKIAKPHAVVQQLILDTARMSFTFVGFGTGATVLRDGFIFNALHLN